MYSFLVLGLIPGTNIQLSFWAWLVIMPLLVVAGRKFRPQVRDLIEWGLAPQPRLPLPANRLHRRLQPTAR
jgi:hypothetical protein